MGLGRKKIRRNVRTRLGNKRSTWFNVPKDSKNSQDGTEASDNIRRKRECTEFQDSANTYVREKIWNTKLQDWYYPKYVECGYVK